MAMDCFNVVWLAGIVPQRRPDLLNALVHPPLKVDVGFVSPECLLDFFAGHKLTGAAGEQSQEPEGLWRQLDDGPGLTQLFGIEIELEDTEAK